MNQNYFSRNLWAPLSKHQMARGDEHVKGEPRPSPSQWYHYGIQVPT